MTLLLKLKHWQLFFLVWGLPFLIGLGTLLHLGIALTLLPFSMIISSICVFGWIAAIAITLHRQLPKKHDLDIQKFKLLFSIPLAYVLLIICWIAFILLDNTNRFEDVNATAIASIIVPLHFISLFIIFWGVRFASKTLKSVEEKRFVKFNDYAAEFFLIWFSFVGFWILQPRLNELVIKS